MSGFSPKVKMSLPIAWWTELTRVTANFPEATRGAQTDYPYSIPSHHGYWISRYGVALVYLCSSPFPRACSFQSSLKSRKAVSFLFPMRASTHSNAIHPKYTIVISSLIPGLTN